MLKLVLETAGYDVDLAENGMAALGLITRNPDRYPAVITDIRMPGLDGYGLMTEARTAGYSGSFVVLAGLLSPDDRQRLHELRVVRVLDKPSRPAEIIDALQSALTGF